MALYDNYFTNEDKPFAENLNDALLLSNVFDMTVDVEAPKMFSNSTWVSTTSLRKCGVSILTLKEGLPSGVSVGTDSTTGNSTLTGTGTVSLSWYPNFNSFGRFKAITWENTGTIVVNLKTTNGTTIASNISKGTIENQSSELRTLQEIVIELVFTNATLKSLTVTMENKQGNRYGATVGITDVTGLTDTITAIQNKNNQQDNRLTGLEGIDENIFNYNLISDYYNVQIDNDININCIVTDVTGERVEGKTLTLYHNSNSVGTATTSELGVAHWTVTCDEWGLQDFRVANTSIQVNVTGWKTVAQDNWYTLKTNGEFVELSMFGTHTVNISTNWTTALTIANDTYRPEQNLMGVGYNQTLYQIHTSGEIRIVRANGSATSTTATGTYYWKLK